MASNDPLEHVPPAVAGGAGGVVASFAQFIGSGSEDALWYLFQGEYQNLMTLLSSLMIITVLMAGCGALVAYFFQSKSQNRWALFAAGVAATAVGAQVVPAVKPILRKIGDIAPISVAYAAAESPECREPLTVVAGIKAIFNLDEKRYRVVVGSFKRPEDAAGLAAKVNKEDPSFNAFVAPPNKCNPYHAVVVSPYVSANEAKKIMDRASQLNAVSGAFLSPAPSR